MKLLCVGPIKHWGTCCEADLYINNMPPLNEPYNWGPFRRNKALLSSSVLGKNKREKEVLKVFSL